jgi:Fe2+ transport system protein FeoA
LPTALQEPRPVSLTDVPAGTRARLHATKLDADTRALLRVLGLTDGSPLQVCKRGDPFIIQVRATRIGVAHAVARDIYVTPQRG